MPLRPLPMSTIRLLSERISPGTTVKGRRCIFYTPASPFSVCTQQQSNRPSRRKVDVSWRRKPGRLQKAEDRRQASIESGNDDAWVDRDLTKVDFRMNKMWLYDILETYKLAADGYDAPARQSLCLDVLNTVREQWDIPEIMRYLRNSYRERCEYPLPVPAEVLTFIGKYQVEKVPQWEQLGLVLLEVAAAMRYEEPIMILGERNFSRGVGPSQTSKWVLDGLESLAANLKDPRAMTLHARNLVLAKQSHHALAVAEDICRATEPGQARTEEKGASDLPLPWKTLLDALANSNKDMADMHRALQYGALVWNDPEACALHAQSPNVPLGSEYWLEYATKGAMGGDLQSMRDIGVYHLGIQGWFPKGGQVSNDLDSRIGFAWLEMFAEFAPPDKAAKVWAGMALVLREHGERARGLAYLQEGLKQIDQRVDLEDAEKKLGFRELDSLIHHWGVQDLVNPKEQKITSETFLGGPIVPLQGFMHDPASTFSNQ